MKFRDIKSIDSNIYYINSFLLEDVLITKMIPAIKHIILEITETNQIILRDLNTFTSCTAAENIDKSKSLLKTIVYKFWDVNRPAQTMMFHAQS